MALISAVASYGAQKFIKGATRALKKKKKRKIVNATASRFADRDYIAAQSFTGPPAPRDYDYEPPMTTRTSNREAVVDLETGELKPKYRRRRRKQLLTASDRQDIAFIVGTLGKGQMGQAAISQLLARACT